MNRVVRTILILLSPLLLTASLLAQKSNEVGLELGGTFTPSRAAGDGEAIRFAPAFTLGLEYDHRIAKTSIGSLSAGIDFAASPFDVFTNSGPSTSIKQYAYIFATPHLRLKLKPVAKVEPWFTLGVGYADYNEGNQRNGNGGNFSGTSGPAGSFGAGVDYKTPVKLILPVIFRLGVRDYLAIAPTYNVPAPATQNNVVVTFGLVLNF